jgi:hypothetical protein
VHAFGTLSANRVVKYRKTGAMDNQSVSQKIDMPTDIESCCTDGKRMFNTIFPKTFYKKWVFR